MKIGFVLGIITLLLVTGCAIEPEDECDGSVSTSDPFRGEPMFDRCIGTNILVNQTTYSVGDTLTVSLSFAPRFTGVGKLIVNFLPRNSFSGAQGVLVVSPEMEARTLNSFSATIDINCDGWCTKNVSFVVQDVTPYIIYGYLSFSDVYDATEDQWYKIGSDEQIEKFGQLDNSVYTMHPAFDLPGPSLE